MKSNTLPSLLLAAALALPAFAARAGDASDAIRARILGQVPLVQPADDAGERAMIDAHEQARRLILGVVMARQVDTMAQGLDPHEAARRLILGQPS